MLELKEIQRSLPHAPQLHNDPDLPELDARGIPRTHFLNTVPVGLVPLISPDTSTTQSKLASTPVLYKPKLEPPTCLSSRPPPSPPCTPPPNISVTRPPSSHNSDLPNSAPAPSSAVEPWVPPPPPPRLPYNIPVQPRPVPRFNFLPLLELPASSVSSVPPHSNPTHRQESLPPSLSSSPVPPPPPDTHSLSFPSCLQSCHHTGISTSISPSKLSFAPKLDRTTNTLPAQLSPPSPLSSTSSPGVEKEPTYDDSTCLEAELSRLWRRQSCHLDGETETESETESSVVHTEAESDSECTRSSTTFSGTAKASRTSVAVVTTTDDDDEDGGEMSLVELESGVMAFVRVPRRK